MNATASRRRRPAALDLDTTSDVRSFRGPWKRTTGFGGSAFRIADVDDEPARRRQCIALISNGFDRERGAWPALTDEQLRLARLLLVAPQMFAALRLVRETATLPAPLATAIDRLLSSVG